MDMNFLLTSCLHISLRDDIKLQYILIFDSLNIEVALKKDYPILWQKKKHTQ